MKVAASQIGEKNPKSRTAIFELLKHEGPLESAVIAERLGITSVAVRQHLYALAERGLVDNRSSARPIGRPVKLWRVTQAGDEHFPDAHAELTVSLLGCIQETFGADSLNRLLEVRKRHLLTLYTAAIPSEASVADRAMALAAIRTQEGYMSSVSENGDGSLLLVENHCPICAAAATCQGFCAIEEEVFGAVLGDEVTLTRTEHIQAGARRCAYLIQPRR